MKFISSKNTQFTTLVVWAGFSLAFSGANPALGQEKPDDDKGSLEEMWTDKSISKPEAKPEQQKGIDTTSDFKIVTPKAGDIQDEEETEGSQENEQDENRTKPLCSIQKLKESVFVKSGGWPGVGPFQSTASDTEFADQYRNQLTLKKAEGNKVSEAQLRLVNLSGNSQDVLSLQMSADFLLEALGARDGKIANFNSRFEEKQNQLKEGSKEKLTFNAGQLEVSILRDKKDSDNKGKTDYLINVVSTEAYTKSTDQNDTADSTSEPDTPDEKTAAVPVSPTSTTEPSSTSILDKPILYPAKQKTTKIAMTPTSAGAKPASDPLKQQFTELIESWQAVKRRAVKNRQKQNLFKILGGKALTKQSQAIKWLLDHHRYYEMTPNSMTLVEYKAITPAKKYEVVAKISERRRFIDANTMHILKDDQSTYTVSYVVENIHGQWLITDSKIVK